MARRTQINNSGKQAVTARRPFIGAILLVTVILYSGIFTNTILYGWDDGEYMQSEDIREFRIGAFFSEYYLGMYQPLPVLTFAVNYAATGENPAPYQTINLLLHLISTHLVFYLIISLTGRNDISAFIAFLFALHPMHVEAVAWISTRSNGLYSAFYLAAMIYYVRYKKESRNKYLIYCYIAFILSLFSKSMAITLPLILLLLDYFLSERILKKDLLTKLPAFGLSVLFGIIAVDASSSFGHITNLQVDYNLSDRFFMISYALAFYLGRALIPVNLSAVYAYPAKTETGLLPAEYYLSFILLIVIVFVLLRRRRFRKDNLFGLLFFLITISAALPLFWSRMLMLADRYTYIPYIGLFFIMGSYLKTILSKENRAVRRIRPAILAVAGGLLIWYAATTAVRIGVWEDAATLTTDIIEKDRSDIDVSIGYFFRGNIRDRAGDPEGALRDYDRAIQLNPDYTLAYNNRGINKGILGEFEPALADFNKAIGLEPDYRDAYYNRGNVKYYLGWKQEACLDWQKAAALGSEQAEKIHRKYCN